MGTKKDIFHSDSPLTNPEHDKLGYATFAKHLAESIYKMAPIEGVVIAINGAWGSGKSTILNFILHYLKSEKKKDNFIFIHFNPWWFSDRKNLTKLFFTQLHANLEGKSYKVLAKKIAHFADLVSMVPIEKVAKAGRITKGIMGGNKYIVSTKEDIEKLLRKQNKKIIITIDDIDRLASGEIRHLFGMVKAVANFPNVIYLLAFEKNVVTKALDTELYQKGEDFLEKIVQAPFEIPLPERIALRKLLTSKLDKILTINGKFDEDFNLSYWTNVYFYGLNDFIKTPRNVNQLINVLRVTYPAIKGEVNPVDIIAIECLRIFCPSVYEIIRKNPGEFTGVSSDRRTTDVFSEDLDSFHQKWINTLPDTQQVQIKALLSLLFPKFATSFGGAHYGGNWVIEWRKNKRICSDEIFLTYFRLAVPEGEITFAEMKTYLSLVNIPDKFSEILLELSSQIRPDGATRLKAFLDRFRDYTEKDISLEHIPSVIDTFVKIGDNLINKEDEPAGMGFEIGNDLQIIFIIETLLKRLKKSERFAILKDTIRNGESLTIIERIVTFLGREHGKYGEENPLPEDERIISLEHLNELESIALEKIRKAAKVNSLMTTPNLFYVLLFWRDIIDDKSEINIWIKKIVQSDQHLLSILTKFLRKTRSQNMGDVAFKTIPRLDPKWLEPFIDPDSIIDRIRKLDEEKDLGEDQKIAIKQFIKEYDLRNEGKDPANIRNW